MNKWKECKEHDASYKKKVFSCDRNEDGADRVDDDGDGGLEEAHLKPEKKGIKLIIYS